LSRINSHIDEVIQIGREKEICVTKSLERCRELFDVVSNLPLTELFISFLLFGKYSALWVAVYFHEFIKVARDY
jgi:hypothetical protein